MYQMMNHDFGVPYSDAEENLKPKGANRFHEKHLAESGLEMNFWNFFIPIVSTVFSSVSKKNDQRQQAQAQDNNSELQYEYNLDAWKKRGEVTQLNYDHNVKKSKATYEHGLDMARLQDEVNTQKYNQQLKIRQLELEGKDSEFGHSEALYEAQIGFNKLSAQAAINAEYNQYQEIRYDNLMKLQDEELSSIVAMGAAKLKGDWRNSRKIAQAHLYQTGVNEQVLYDSLLSGAKATKDAINQVGLDKLGADVRAQAERIKQPGEVPMPLQPFATPLPMHIPPRPLTEADFGAAPIKGAAAYAPSAMSTVGDVVGGLGSLDQNVWEGLGDWLKK
tara:strand:+ start:5210 stop:6208 length:999 start_codon:yes stop_codon:yes gene_type:complete